MSKEPTRFKQTEIGELPEGWEVKPLREVLSLSQGGIWGDEPDNSVDVFPVLRSTEIDHEGNLHLDSPTMAWRKVPKQKAERYALKDGDILVVKSSGSAHLLGRVALFRQQGEQIFLFSNFLHRLRANDEICNSIFLYYVLISPIAKQTLKQIQETTSGLRNLPMDEYLQMPIPLPPLEEQKRIAGVLRLVDRVAEETRRIVDIYERAKRFALKRLLTRGIGHTRFKQTEIGELPEGWEVKKLGEIATIKQGGRLGLTKKDYVPEGYPAFSATGQDGYVPVYEYEGEAIILSSIGAQCGKCFYATGKWTTLANTQIIFVNPEIANTLFIFYQVNRPNFWVRLGSAQPFIRPSDVKNAKVIIPPLEEQKQIVEMLSTIDVAIENERRYLGVLEKCKRWLLDNLLIGKIRLSPEVDEILILKGVLPDAF
jgi:type I restriction enzyme S subunit